MFIIAVMVVIEMAMVLQPDAFWTHKTNIQFKTAFTAVLIRLILTNWNSRNTLRTLLATNFAR